MKKVTDTLKNLKLEGEEKRAVTFAKNFMIAMTEAVDQIREEVDQAMRDQEYPETVLSYNDVYGNDAFSGLSRAADILDDKMRKVSFLEEVQDFKEEVEL